MNRVVYSEAMIREVFPSLKELKDQELAGKIAKAWIEAFEMSSWERLEDCWLDPGSDRLVRLVDHINCQADMMEAVNEAIVKYHPDCGCDVELLKELALMHDISKVVEFEPDGNGRCRHSKFDYYYQHALLGAYLAKKYGMPEKLVHLIYTHADKCPTNPQYREGWFFTHIDHLHWDMAMFTHSFFTDARRIYVGKENE